MEEKNFFIKKVKKVQDYWELYPKGDEKPIRLKVEDVYGNLPPVWKFPWQCHKLQLKVLLSRHIVYANMDGLVLFNIPEDKYSEEIKRDIAESERLDKEIEAFTQAHHNELRAQLKDYLPKVPAVSDIEEKINDLPICWSRFMMLHLQMQYGNKEEQQRLSLLYWLVKIADKLYKRYVDTESAMDVVFASHKMMCKTLGITDLSEDSFRLIKTNADYDKVETLIFFKEVYQELLHALPQCPESLEFYLAQTICRLIADYADDAADIYCKRPRDLWGGTINTDREAYRYLATEMNLPRFSSLVIDKPLKKEDIESFVNRY